MEKVSSVRAVENSGLEGDRHAMPDSSRQVLLIEQETLVDYGIAVGAIRENITTQGINLMTLPPGTRLAVGGAVLETTRECEPCNMVNDVRPGLRGELRGKRGMLARVVQGGELRIGDRIRVLK
jgi:MOSC domain-containing protein YiiM